MNVWIVKSDFMCWLWFFYFDDIVEGFEVIFNGIDVERFIVWENGGFCNEFRIFKECLIIGMMVWLEKEKGIEVFV